MLFDKTGAKVQSKKGFFSFLEVLKNILWSKVRLELIKVIKAALQSMELQWSCCRAGLQLSVGLEAVERMPSLTRHFECFFFSTCSIFFILNVSVILVLSM